MGDKKVELSEVAEIIMGQSPKGETYNNFGDGYPLLNGPSEFGEIYPIPEKWTTDPKRFSKEGDILFCVRGSTGSMNWSDRDYSIGRGLCAIRAKTGKQIDTYYIYYSLLSNLPKLLNRGTGSVFPNLSKKDIHTFAINWPKKSIRRDIARKLRNLDEKIELNRQMNETLEAIARAIFKSWFVDFDPVKAKMAGEPYPLPDAVMALFPDALVESELGLIPRGWEVGKLEDLAVKVENGGTPKKSEPLFWNNGYIPWLTSGEVRQNLISSTDNFITELGLKNSSAKIWEPGTTIIALYGATAGEVSMSNIKLTANQACCGLSPKKHCQYYLYLTASRATDLLANQARGSAQQNLSQGIVKNFKCIIPLSDLLIKFESFITPTYEKINLNLEEIAILKQFRDTLLPKMISGEVEV